MRMFVLPIFDGVEWWIPATPASTTQNIGCPSIMTPSKMGKTNNLIFYSLIEELAWGLPDGSAQDRPLKMKKPSSFSSHCFTPRVENCVDCHNFASFTFIFSYFSSYFFHFIPFWSRGLSGRPWLSLATPLFILQLGCKSLAYRLSNSKKNDISGYFIKMFSIMRMTSTWCTT